MYWWSVKTSEDFRVLWNSAENEKERGWFCWGEEIDNQTTRSRVFSNMHHRCGLKVDYSAGGQSHYCNDERQMSAALSARESVHFLPPDFIKRRFTRLSLKHRCCQEGWGGGVKRAMGLQGLCSACEVWQCRSLKMCVHMSAHTCMEVGCGCVCCVSVHTLLAPVALVAECLSCSGLSLTSPCWSKMRDESWDILYLLALVALGLALITDEWNIFLALISGINWAKAKMWQGHL